MSTRCACVVELQGPLDRVEVVDQQGSLTSSEEGAPAAAAPSSPSYSSAPEPLPTPSSSRPAEPTAAAGPQRPTTPAAAPATWPHGASDASRPLPTSNLAVTAVQYPELPGRPPSVGPQPPAGARERVASPPVAQQGSSPATPSSKQPQRWSAVAAKEGAAAAAALPTAKSGTRFGLPDRPSSRGPEARPAAVPVAGKQGRGDESSPTRVGSPSAAGSLSGTFLCLSFRC